MLILHLDTCWKVEENEISEGKVTSEDVGGKTYNSLKPQALISKPQSSGNQVPN